MAPHATKRQKTIDVENSIIHYISTYRSENGFSPSYREMMEMLQFASPSNVKYHVDRLIREGRLKGDPKIARSLSAPGRDGFVDVPIVGAIAAGAEFVWTDSQSTDQVDELDKFEVPAEMIGRARNPFALEVKGESMVDALIADGDTVIIEQAETARRGEMVAARIKSRDEYTLKYFYPEGDMVRLQPANSQMQPIIEPASDVEVVGKAVSVLRRY